MPSSCDSAFTHGRMSLKDFIQAYLEGVVHTRTYYLDSVSKALPENPTHAYLLLILQIKRYYPDLGERYYEIMQEEVALWKKVLTDAVTSGEIGPQQDLDTVAATFQSLFYGTWTPLPPLSSPFSTATPSTPPSAKPSTPPPSRPR